MKYPICFRLNSSDIRVYQQIFAAREYACLNNIKDIKLIVDCGAYIGLSSIWFLNEYRNADLVAIEPDPKNFSILQKNLRPYGQRAKLLKAAIWPRKGALVASKEKYRDGQEWTRQVRECVNNEKPEINAINIDSIISESGFEKIDILKIDIERSEIELFSHNYKQWLSKTRNIVIELHDEECSKVFFKALSGYNYLLSRSGELTCCQGLTPKK